MSYYSGSSAKQSKSWHNHNRVWKPRWADSSSTSNDWNRDRNWKSGNQPQRRNSGYWWNPRNHIDFSQKLYSPSENHDFSQDVCFPSENDPSQPVSKHQQSTRNEYFSQTEAQHSNGRLSLGTFSSRYMCRKNTRNQSEDSSLAIKTQKHLDWTDMNRRTTKNQNEDTSLLNKSQSHKDNEDQLQSIVQLQKPNKCKQGESKTNNYSKVQNQRKFIKFKKKRDFAKQDDMSVVNESSESTSLSLDGDKGNLGTDSTSDLNKTHTSSNPDCTVKKRDSYQITSMKPLFQVAALAASNSNDSVQSPSSLCRSTSSPENIIQEQTIFLQNTISPHSGTDIKASLQGDFLSPQNSNHQQKSLLQRSSSVPCNTQEQVSVHRKTPSPRSAIQEPVSLHRSTPSPQSTSHEQGSVLQKPTSYNWQAFMPRNATSPRSGIRGLTSPKSVSPKVSKGLNMEPHFQATSVEKTLSANLSPSPCVSPLLHTNSNQSSFTINQDGESDPSPLQSPKKTLAQLPVSDRQKKSTNKTKKLDKTKQYDKELISRLVNCPQSRKQQMILKKYLQEYTRSRKKLSYPRFNLHVIAAECDGKEYSDLDLEKLISEIDLTDLPIEVLNSIASAWEDDQPHQCRNSKESPEGNSENSNSINFPVEVAISHSSSSQCQPQSSALPPSQDSPPSQPSENLSLTNVIGAVDSWLPDNVGTSSWLPCIKQEVTSNPSSPHRIEIVDPDVISIPLGPTTEQTIKKEPADLPIELENATELGVTEPLPGPCPPADSHHVFSEPPSQQESISSPSSGMPMPNSIGFEPLNIPALSELIAVSKQEVLLEAEIQMLRGNITKSKRILDELHEKERQAHSELITLREKRLGILYRLQVGAPQFLQESNKEEHIQASFSGLRADNDPGSFKSPSPPTQPSSSIQNISTIVQDIINNIRSQLQGATGLPDTTVPPPPLQTPSVSTSVKKNQHSAASSSGNVTTSKGKRKRKNRKTEEEENSNASASKQQKISESAMQEVSTVSLGEEQEIILCTIMPNKQGIKNGPSSNLSTDFQWNVRNLQAHETAVIDIKISGDYLYTCSSDATAKRFDLRNPEKVVVYEEHTKTVTSFEVVEGVNESVTKIYTGSHDGFLRGFEAETGRCMTKLNVNGEIICMTQGWGQLYLGLYSGIVYRYSLTLNRPLESFRCSSSTIGRLCTATEGALHLLCVASYDDTITIRDATNGLLIRCLEGSIPSPYSLVVAGCTVYTSTMQRSVFLHDLRNGKMIHKINCSSSVTNLHVGRRHLIACCFDGIIRCYSLKNWLCINKYYGAGRSALLCMDISGNKLVSGNQEGLVESLDFNPDVGLTCQFLHCISKFGRTEDLMFHVEKDHGQMLHRQKVCPWQTCKRAFTNGMKSEEMKHHILNHVESLRLKDEEVEVL